MANFTVKTIGRIASPLSDLDSAPKQADKGAPEAWVIFGPEMLEAS
jgi:hypothetical protein